MKKRASIVIANETIKAGQSRCVKLSLAMLYTSTPIEIPVYVFHGKKEGPVLFVTAAIHGDEINGVEIIRRVHHAPQLKRLRGTLITIPIVNVYGFFLHSRYLPDRRDLNRQFPGREKGSMASKLANLIMTEIVEHSTHGIDLHTGAIHRSNYPQTRFSHQCEQSAVLAEAFGAPIMVAANMRDGSLREATDNMDIPMIIYEGGEALRFDELAIRIGVRGVLNVMTFLQMFSPSQSKMRKRRKRKDEISTIAESTFWVRASESGVLINCKSLGEKVSKGELLCTIVDPLGDNEIKVKSPCAGVIIGKTNIPLVNEGDAIFHIALFEDLRNLQLPDDDLDDWD
ncbi:succinylglutamate desuccinylase/aspartoacylase family protein [Legionella hackeliae]|uniref:Succinylglutamate desuccinylase/aspartoacylase family protein n=1 Tax=Legionella hackeliae TaxID=449 RepID=A0A0A8UV85_LEGHA|nr:succinylglutamate desuccinylase/aspartoacylase family protein [Legionella hackeliae]KTD15199.1 succinylglutamate desuccinylase / aspartoacylase family protein [Legionella hackeliae]CEK11436.1 Succinylglutamate desuccinylase/aspartoacylase family protein [Legionella hackeliae]STX48208.1 succinylglutamate desuccinylase / aspartoacylase family [Legionella hackeliae]